MFKFMLMEKINSTKLTAVQAPFSTAVKANGFLFLSGQIGLDKTGKLVSGFENEAKQILDNVITVLNENHLSEKNVAAITIYLKDMRDFQLLNEVYKTYFQFPYPSRTCIAVADLPMKASVEMTVTAALP
jgi:2-iminobutanoate/2-iminopropanoate deaminase